MNRRPIAPDDPRTRDYDRSQVLSLLRELRTRGRPHGLLWGSAGATESTLDGRILVDFGNAPVSTLLNLLHLVREARDAAEDVE